MEREQYAIMARREERHWWYAGMRRVALAVLERVLRPGGLFLLRVPAHDWLRGEHDRLVHTRHRYSRGEVSRKLADAGFGVERLTWANTVLFLPAVAKRLLERTNGHDAAAAEPD